MQNVQTVPVVVVIVVGGGGGGGGGAAAAAAVVIVVVLYVVYHVLCGIPCVLAAICTGVPRKCELPIVSHKLIAASCERGYAA